MVIDETNENQINTALLLVQRRIDRIKQVMDAFTEALKQCSSVEDIKKLSLKITGE